ncbi:nicotinamide-nucleotide amidohydrolase family protein [Sphingobacterium shayense]|uniref:CinA family protein n=1 Tax=Sphingobacterium shayense TaxID=626343 RepID=UPI001553B1A9|nr:nicotinamide-nucleotide amidohydrolase family protein [Sphingobacterium shayense]NQD72070.1 nicotinamide-nucleotide amidohydrolase family protein [Sphingobacterium shayense]
MEDYRDTVAVCCKNIADKKLSIAFAESATAGKMAYEFSLTAYSGDILKGGLVCYDACVKEEILGISKELIRKFTPESVEVTREMCLQIKKQMKADITVAITGLTTPGGSESEDKPVGTIFYSIAFASKVTNQRILLAGTPEEIINSSIAHICHTLINIIEVGSQLKQ